MSALDRGKWRLMAGRVLASCHRVGRQSCWDQSPGYLLTRLLLLLKSEWEHWGPQFILSQLTLFLSRLQDPSSKGPELSNKML